MPIQIMTAEELRRHRGQQPVVNKEEPTVAPATQPTPAVTPETPQVTAAPQEAGTLGEQFEAGVEEMKGWGAQFIGMAPAASKDTSRTMAAYAQAKQDKANRVQMAVQDFGEVMDNPTKIFQYGAERFARSVPGMLPYAIPGVGQALGAGTTFATTAGRIYGEQEEKDAGSALLGATGTTAMEGLGMGQLLKTPVAKGIVRDITGAVVSEGATEGGQQIIENIASGKEDIFEGVPESIAAGGVIGGGIRTGAQIPRMPAAAKETAQRISDIRRKRGGVDVEGTPLVNHSIRRAVDQSAEMKDINQALVVETDPATREELLRRRSKLNEQGGTGALFSALDEMDKAGITLSPEALDMEVNEGLSRNSRVVGSAAELAGFSDKSIKAARRARGLAKAGIQSKIGLLPGQTPEQTISNNRKKGREYLSNIAGEFDDRINKFTNMITDMDYAQRHTTSPEDKAFLNDNLFKLRNGRKQVEDLVKAMRSETRDRATIYDSMAMRAQDLDQFLTSNNIDVEFNPIQLAQKFILADKALVNQDPAFHEGITDEAADVQALGVKGISTIYTSGMADLVGLSARIRDKGLRKQVQKAIDKTRRLAAEEMRAPREEVIDPEGPTPPPSPETPTPTPTDAATQSIVEQAQAISPTATIADVGLAMQPEVAPVVREPDLGMVTQEVEPVAPVEEAPVTEAPVEAGTDTSGMIPQIQQIKSALTEVVDTAVDGNPEAKAAAAEVLDEDMGEALTREEVMDVIDDALGAGEEAAIKAGDDAVVEEIRAARDQIDMLPIPKMVEERAPEAAPESTVETVEEDVTTRQLDKGMIPQMVSEVREELTQDPTVDEEKVSTKEVVEEVIRRNPDLGMIPKIRKLVEEEVKVQEAPVEAEVKEPVVAVEEEVREPDLGMVPRKEEPVAPVEEDIEPTTAVEEAAEPDMVMIPRPKVPKVTEEKADVPEVIAPETKPYININPETGDYSFFDTEKEAKSAAKEGEQSMPLFEAAEADLIRVKVPKALQVGADGKVSAVAIMGPDKLMIPKLVKEVQQDLEEAAAPEEVVTADEVVEEVINRNPDLSMIPKIKEVIKEEVVESTKVEEKPAEVEEKPTTSVELVYNSITEARETTEALENLSEEIEDLEGIVEEPTTEDPIITAREMVPPVREEKIVEPEPEVEELSDAVEDVVENRNPDLGMIPKEAIKAINKAHEEVQEATQATFEPVRLGNIEEVKAMRERNQNLTIAKRRQLATNTLVEKGGDVESQDFQDYLEGITSNSTEADVKRKVSRLAKRHIIESEKVAKEKLKELTEAKSVAGGIEKDISNLQWDNLKLLAEEHNVDDATLGSIKGLYEAGKFLTSSQQANIIREFSKVHKKDVDKKIIESDWNEIQAAAEAQGVSKDFMDTLRKQSTSPTKGLKEATKADFNTIQREIDRIKKSEKQEAEGYDWDLIKNVSKTFDIPMKEVTKRLQKFVDTEGNPRNLTESEFKQTMSGFEKYKTPEVKEEVSKADIDARWAELEDLAAQKEVSEAFVTNLKRKATKAGKGLQDVPSSAWDAVIKEGKRVESEDKAAKKAAAAEIKDAENTFDLKYAREVGETFDIKPGELKEMLGRYVDSEGKPRLLTAKEFDNFYTKLEKAKKAQDTALVREQVATDKAKADREADAEKALLDQRAQEAERDAMAAKVVKKAAQWTALDKLVKKLGLPKKTLDALKTSHKDPETGKLTVISDSKYRSTIEKMYKDYDATIKARKDEVESKRTERLEKAQKESLAKAQEKVKEAEDAAQARRDAVEAERKENLVKLKADLQRRQESRKQQNKIRLEATKRKAKLAKEKADAQKAEETKQQQEADKKAKESRDELIRQHKERMATLKARNEAKAESRKKQRDLAAQRFKKINELNKQERANTEAGELYINQVNTLQAIGSELGIDTEVTNDIIDTAFGRISSPLSEGKYRSVYAQLKKRSDKAVSGKADRAVNNVINQTAKMGDTIKQLSSGMKELNNKINALEKTRKATDDVDMDALVKGVSETTANQMLKEFDSALATASVDVISNFNEIAKSLIKAGKATKKAKEVEEASRVMKNVLRRIDYRRNKGYGGEIRGTNGLFFEQDLAEIRAVMGQGAFTSYIGPLGRVLRGRAFGIVKKDQAMFNSLDDYKQAILKKQKEETKPAQKQQPKAPQKGALDIEITKQPFEIKEDIPVKTFEEIQEEIVTPVINEVTSNLELDEKARKEVRANLIKSAVESKKPKVETTEELISRLGAESKTRMDKKIQEEAKAKLKKIETQTPPKTTKTTKAVSKKQPIKKLTNEQIDAELGRVMSEAEPVEAVGGQMGRLLNNFARTQNINNYKKLITQITTSLPKPLDAEGKPVDLSPEETVDSVVENVPEIFSKDKRGNIKLASFEKVSLKKLGEQLAKMQTKARVLATASQDVNLKERSKAASAELARLAKEGGVDLNAAIKNYKNTNPSAFNGSNPLSKKEQAEVARVEKQLEAISEARAGEASEDIDLEESLSTTKKPVGILSEVDIAEQELGKVKTKSKVEPIEQTKLDPVDAEERGFKFAIVNEKTNKVINYTRSEKAAESKIKKSGKKGLGVLAIGLLGSAGAASAAEGESLEEMVDRYKEAGVLTESQARSFTRIGNDMLKHTGKSLDSVVDTIEGLFKTFNKEQVDKVKPRTPKKKRSHLADKLGMRESSNNYKAVNRLGYTGKYQFGSSALQDLGMVKAKPKGVSQSKWLKDPKAWTGRFGIKSQKEFLNNPQVQEKVFKLWESKLDKRTTSRGLDKHIGERIDGVIITRDGINAASHLLGHGNVQKALKSGNLTKWKDANGVTIKEYMTLMKAK